MLYREKLGYNEHSVIVNQIISPKWPFYNINQPVYNEPNPGYNE